MVMVKMSIQSNYHFRFFVFDLGCPTKISQVTLRNSHNGQWNNWYVHYKTTYLSICIRVVNIPRAVKDWTLEIGSAWTGPWSLIASGTLQSPFPLKANNQLPVPLVVTQFDSTMAQVCIYFFSKKKINNNKYSHAFRYWNSHALTGMVVDVHSSILVWIEIKVWRASSMSQYVWKWNFWHIVHMQLSVNIDSSGLRNNNDTYIS